MNGFPCNGLDLASLPSKNRALKLATLLKQFFLTALTCLYQTAVAAPPPIGRISVSQLKTAFAICITLLTNFGALNAAPKIEKNVYTYGDLVLHQDLTRKELDQFAKRLIEFGSAWDEDRYDRIQNLIVETSTTQIYSDEPDGDPTRSVPSVDIRIFTEEPTLARSQRMSLLPKEAVEVGNRILSAQSTRISFLALDVEINQTKPSRVQLWISFGYENRFFIDGKPTDSIFEDPSKSPRKPGFQKSKRQVGHNN